MSAPAPGTTDTPVWRRVVVWGLAYFVIGTVTAALSRGAGSGRMVVVWRWTAWLVSAVAFAAQIWYERVRAAAAPGRAALRAALGVAVGGFLLAAWAMGHSLSVGADRIGAHIVALVAWPLLLFVSAFLVAWAAAALLARSNRD